MIIRKRLVVKSRNDWRKWLEENNRKEKEIWLEFYKKSTGKQTVSLNEAIEEALCFGWIDNVGKGISPDRFVLRFSPRKPNSNWSANNLDKVKELIAGGKMTETGFNSLPGNFKRN